MQNGRMSNERERGGMSGKVNSEWHGIDSKSIAATLQAQRTIKCTA